MFSNMHDLHVASSVAPYNAYKVMVLNAHFPFFTSSLKQPIGGTSYYFQILPDSRPSNFVKIKLKFYQQTFVTNLENDKNTKICFFNKISKNLVLQNC